MNTMTKDEHNELREKILTLAHDALNTIDWHYLHNRSKAFALFKTLAYIGHCVETMQTELSRELNQDTQ